MLKRCCKLRNWSCGSLSSYEEILINKVPTLSVPFTLHLNRCTTYDGGNWDGEAFLISAILDFIYYVGKQAYSFVCLFIFNCSGPLVECFNIKWRKPSPQEYIGAFSHAVSMRNCFCSILYSTSTVNLLVCGQPLHRGTWAAVDIGECWWWAKARRDNASKTCYSKEVVSVRHWVFSSL